MEGQARKQLVFVGLGNSGPAYAMTRHNVGAIVVQGLAKLCGMPFKEEKRLLAKAAKGTLEGAQIHLVLPATYMNESGQAVRRYLDYHKLGPQHLVAVSDDADLPFGEIRLRSQGSSGGHNGLKSIQTHLGTTNYARLKIGIGRGERESGELKDHVLEGFSKEESEQLPAIVADGIRALRLLAAGTVESAMNVVNLRRQPKVLEKKQEEKL